MIGAGRDELGESYLHDIALKPRANAPVVLEAEGADARAVLSQRFVSRRMPARCLGVYGFMGCGQIELARMLFGKLKPERGALRLDGAVARLTRHHRTPRTPASASCRKAGA